MAEPTVEEQISATIATRQDAVATDADIAKRQTRLAEVAEQLDTAPPQDILRWAVERYGGDGKLALACSFGMQSVVLIDMLAKLGVLSRVQVFYLDTGVLFGETHQTRLRIQNAYGFQAVRVAPALTWDQQQAQHGGHLYERGMEGINQCCDIRKVQPMRKHLAGKAAWLTGMRRRHNDTRHKLPIVLWDHANGLVKINPVAAIDDATLWGYIKANDVPYNPLYDQGYGSIGCNTPVCTRPIKPGEDPRAGRWAGLNKTECGIHVDGKSIRSLESSQL
jgi:phosphoadenosine phosphosulfate reductase